MVAVWFAPMSAGSRPERSGHGRRATLPGHLESRRFPAHGFVFLRTPRSMIRTNLVALVAIQFLLPVPQVRAAEKEQLEFRLRFDAAALDAPFTGRVVVRLTKSSPGELPSSISWSRPEPVFAKDVTGWKPGEPLVIDGTALWFPTPFKDIAQGEWYVSA